ncbi:MAG: tRNA pseudouridine(55) synthase TruB [Bryobacteraceae bacterium]|nr:tRNA pseudouridine(55) synthase TruB [Bryobacteraceae bacterium]
MELNGLIVLDKPAGWTSHDAVNKVRRLTGQTKVGHLGTLDPMATGVLPLVVGKATRLAQFVAVGRKVYETEIRFGFATDTYDREGEPLAEPQAIVLEAATVREWLSRQLGTQAQMPPPISAKKINGVPAYKLARQKLPVELKAVEVTIDELALLSCAADRLRLRVVCSAGTYIRAIAHELGRVAGCGAHLTELRRLESCGFGLEQSHPMEELVRMAATSTLSDAVLPSATLLPQFPSVRVDHDTVAHIRQGRMFRMSPFLVSAKDARQVKAVSDQGELIAIGEARMPLVYHPIVVF